MTIYRDGDRFRRALLNQERAASREMIRSYGAAWERISKRLDALLGKIAQARATGQPVSMSWLFEQQRLQSLQTQVEVEMQRWARQAAPQIGALQRQAVTLAERQAEAETMAALGKPPPGITLAQVKGSWTRLSKEALTDLVGFTRNGTPLRGLLDALGTEASQQVRDALIAGLATGENPRSIARRVKEAFGGDLVRALRVSRTETMRAYRTAAVRSYEANQDVVKGWIWNAACDVRTCAACWAKHGSEHTFKDELNDHPNGRCSRSPWVKTWAELGFEGMDEKAPTPTGEDRFAKLTAEQQDKVLGKAGGAAYRAKALKVNGERVTLSDFATTKTSAAWGTHVQRKSLKGVLGAEGAKEWREEVVEAVREATPVSRINFDTARPQHLGMLDDMQRLYAEDEPGREYVRSAPVQVNEYLVRHLVEDRPERREWVSSQARAISRILSDPELVERHLRKSKAGYWRQTVVGKADGDEHEYVVVALSLANLPGEVDSQFHQVTTVHWAEWQDLYTADGKPRSRWVLAKK